MGKQDAVFYHETVMLKEAVAALEIKEGGVYVDATFGGGGHSREIIAQLSENGKLISFDQDEDAWVNKIEEYITMTSEQREVWHLQSKMYLKNNHSKELIMQNWDNIFLSINKGG